MKKLDLDIVQSVMQPHLLSVRGANGSLKEGLVASGFKAGDRVVVILAEDYEALQYTYQAHYGQDLDEPA